MQVTLTDEMARFVEEQVKAGRFRSAQEVVEAGLARMILEDDPDDGELDAETLAAIEEGERQLDRGEGIPLEEAFAQLRRDREAGAP